MARKAVALVSGGLDSTLVVALLARLGVEVIAYHGVSAFSPRTDSEEGLERLRQKILGLGAAEFVTRDVTRAMLAFTKHPAYGHGKHLNACLDCRLMNLRFGKEAMDRCGADFLATGEVVGQRPMSQRRDALGTVDRELRAIGLEGLLLRPLSAKCLPVTIPEKEGWVDREKLFGFSGRNRTPQMELAAEWGITDYETPAGGCLLTDANYCAKLEDLLKHTPACDPDDLRLLRVGKHFRVDPSTKLVVSRREEENHTLTGLAQPADRLYITEEKPGGIVLLRGPGEPEAERLAAGLAVYHSKFRSDGAGPVKRWTTASEEGDSLGPCPAAAPAQTDPLRVAGG